MEAPGGRTVSVDVGDVTASVVSPVTALSVSVADESMTTIYIVDLPCAFMVFTVEVVPSVIVPKVACPPVGNVETILVDNPTTITTSEIVEP